MKNHTKRSIISITSFIIDMLILAVCMKLSDLLAVYMGDMPCLNYANMGVFCLAAAFFFYMFDLYAAKEDTRESTTISVILTIPIAIVLLLIVSLFWKGRAVSGYFLLFLLLFSELAINLWRLILSFVSNKFREKNKILILETAAVSSRLARKIKYSRNNLDEAFYYIVDEEKEGEHNFVLDNVIKEYDVVFISDNLSEGFQSKVFERCILLGKTINKLATPSNVALVGGSIHQFADTPVIELRAIRMTKFERFLKRTFDIFVSVVGIVITSPVFLILPILIKLDSEGPVFYTQERYTINKKKFNVYKFRTMRVDAEKFGEALATKDDPRITKVGKIIRQLRLDELPQFFNILFGSMSVVGPRPERPVFADEYSKMVKNFDMRYTMKAGLTGYAQVYGKYNTRISDKILLDMVYAIKYSFWLDIKLVILTVKTMFIKSSTDGVEEEADAILNTPEKELERISGNTEYKKGAKENEDICNNTGV